MIELNSNFSPAFSLFSPNHTNIHSTFPSCAVRGAFFTPPIHTPCGLYKRSHDPAHASPTARRPGPHPPPTRPAASSPPPARHPQSTHPPTHPPGAPPPPQMSARRGIGVTGKYGPVLMRAGWAGPADLLLGPGRAVTGCRVRRRGCDEPEPRACGDQGRAAPDVEACRARPETSRCAESRRVHISLPSLPRL